VEEVVSCDLAVWFPDRILSDEQALEQYHELCDENIDRFIPYPSISNFYLELYEIHPEIDDVPEEKIGDFDFSPWSVAHDVSDRHIRMSCVWSHADYVHDLIVNLAQKYGLVVFDPQLTKIHYPTH
jgi:translation elongation factor EF-Tu-like GTPase